MKVLAKLPLEQAADPLLKKIINQLQSTPTRPQLNKYSLSQPENALMMNHGDGRKVFVVPDSQQLAIMDIFHKSPVMGGHPQATVTKLHIGRYFWWEKWQG